jgi:hypothetical protein
MIFTHLPKLLSALYKIFTTDICSKKNSPSPLLRNSYNLNTVYLSNHVQHFRSHLILDKTIEHSYQ